MNEEVLTVGSEPTVETTAPPTVTDPDQPTAEEQVNLPSESEQPEQEVDLDAQPETSGDFEKYKPLFKDNPELKTILGRERAFSELSPNGSFQELKQIVERIPSLDDADRLATDSANHRAFGETYRSDPRGFAESLQENDPNAFSKVVQSLPEVLASTDPNLYREQSKYYTTNVLENLYAVAQRSQNSDAAKAIESVAQMLGSPLGSPRVESRGQSEVERLRQELRERDQKETFAKAETFWEGANEEYSKTAIADIETMIRKSIPSVTDGQLRRMVNEVWTGVNERLGSQPQTSSQIEAYKKAVAQGRMTPGFHKEIVDFSSRRAKQLMPLVWKQVSAEWTKEIVSLQQKKIEDKKTIANASREITPSSAPSTTGRPTPRNGNKRTFSNIFESLRNGTYSPKSA